MLVWVFCLSNSIKILLFREGGGLDHTAKGEECFGLYNEPGSSVATPAHSGRELLFVSVSFASHPWLLFCCR